MESSSAIPNIRAILGWKNGYNLINREERNWAAIFYFLLLQPGNLERFLRLVGSSLPLDPKEVGVYFEYAYLRDLWAHEGEQKSQEDKNKTKRELIVSHLRPLNAESLMKLDVGAFNQYFGAGPRPSSEYIQSPATWSISRFKETIGDNDEFLRTCKFKWSFNAKPDIVVHTTHDTAICIEAKFDSAEGSYPTQQGEISEFERRKLERVSQTSLQRYLMEDLLGIRTEFVFLVKNPPVLSPTHRVLLWKDAYSSLDTLAAPAFIQQWIQRA